MGWAGLATGTENMPRLSKVIKIVDIVNLNVSSEPALLAPLASRFQEASPLPPEEDLSRKSKDFPPFYSLPVKQALTSQIFNFSIFPSFVFSDLFLLDRPFFYLLRVLPIRSPFFSFYKPNILSPKKT